MKKAARSDARSGRSGADLLSPACCLWLAILVCFAGRSLALAENRDGAFSISPFAGGQGFPFGGDTHYDGDFNWGVRAGYNLTDRMTAEVVFGLNQTVHDPEVAYCDIYQYGADLLYHFRPKHRFVPFVAAGFGVFDVKFDDPSDADYEPLDDETNPYFNFGGGCNFAFTRWLEFRVDFRHAIMLNSGDNAMQGVLGFRFQF